MRKGLNKLSEGFRRVADFVMALFSLIVFAPLFLYCYLRIKQEDGGYVIFRQERIGLGGRPFTIYKFRSTRLDVKD